MAEEYLENRQQDRNISNPESIYYSHDYAQPQLDSFSAAMARAHMAASGFHPMPYGNIGNMGHPVQAHMAHHAVGGHLENERAAQEYYHFAQQQHAQEYAHHQQQQQQVLSESSRVSKSNVSASADFAAEGKYQCSMCERSFSRFHLI